MKIHRSPFCATQSARCVAVLCLITVSSGALAQRPDTEALRKSQREKLAPLAKMDGQWRGTAWYMMQPGQKMEITQTERVGSMLDGAVKVIEGRGYNDQGKVVFNAFATLAYDPAKEKCMMHSHSEGRVGDFEVQITDTGFKWEIPAGPMTIRYTATIEGDQWRETGERIVEGRDPIQFFEMNLTKIGETEWPSAGAVPPQSDDEPKTPSN
jgi:hypothetical protein